MLKAQAIADLAIMLTGITSTDRAQEAIQRALRSTGLTHATKVDSDEFQQLLAALAAEGGPIQELAERIAMYSLAAAEQDMLNVSPIGLGPVDPTDKSAA